MGAISLLLSPVAAGTDPDGVDYAHYAPLLERYATENGVAYEAWADHADDLALLRQVLNDFARVDVASLSTEAQKAFYINLYNAAMLQAVFEHWPIETVKTIGLLPFSVFKKPFIEQGDRRLSLDDVEKAILLKDYFDPRIHFAVNCASESCPPLRAEPFTAARLEAQLNEQTRLFAESKRAARIDHESKTVAYSELLKWYADDFPGDNPAIYLNRYRDDALPVDYRIDWIPYDWSLNAAAMKPDRDRLNDR
jgi:hypothetical protein